MVPLLLTSLLTCLAYPSYDKSCQLAKHFRSAVLFRMIPPSVLRFCGTLFFIISPCTAAQHGIILYSPLYDTLGVLQISVTFVSVDGPTAAQHHSQPLFSWRLGGTTMCYSLLLVEAIIHVRINEPKLFQTFLNSFTSFLYPSTSKASLHKI